ncbi:hypothetical protein H312_00189 [Anncaliia algerae PRA339]|uniref:Uncharacterized protein n=1 Tax=Anncaliia algerae PRA339 TaxID=1288291 RepID=A0A059F6C7_9MICR|nr:hypothetical protein H312_00189 [Anncaliia algerae PRA339]
MYLIYFLASPLFKCFYMRDPLAEEYDGFDIKKMSITPVFPSLPLFPPNTPEDIEIRAKLTNASKNMGNLFGKIFNSIKPILRKSATKYDPIYLTLKKDKKPEKDKNPTKNDEDGEKSLKPDDTIQDLPVEDESLDIEPSDFESGEHEEESQKKSDLSKNPSVKNRKKTIITVTGPKPLDNCECITQKEIPIKEIGKENAERMQKNFKYSKSKKSFHHSVW